MAFNYSPKIVTNGLVLYLDAANPRSYTSGSNMWTDLGPTNYGMILNSNPTYSANNGGNITFINGSYATGSTPNLPSGNTAFSKSAWIKSQYKGTNINHPNIMSWGSNSANRKNGLSLQTNVAGTNAEILQWFFANDYSCSITDVTNNWANITVTYSPPTLIFYVNGISQSMQTVTGTPNVDGSALEMGRYGASSQYYFSGSIATAQIYNRALSASEVLQNYNATRTRFGL